MTNTYDKRIDKLLQASEQSKRRLSRPQDKRLRRALIYRSKAIPSGGIYSPHKGLFVRRDYWNALCRSDQVLHMIRALSYLHPHWIFDGYTAAAARGWNVPYALLDDIHIVSPYHYRTHSLVARTCKGVECETVNGIRVATVAQTIHQCLHTADLRDALPIADSALRQLHISKDDLIRMVWEDRTVSRNRSSRRTIEILNLASPLSESGGESLARATMILLGFAVPERARRHL